VTGTHAVGSSARGGGIAFVGTETDEDTLVELVDSAAGAATAGAKALRKRTAKRARTCRLARKAGKRAKRPAGKRRCAARRGLAAR